MEQASGYETAVSPVPLNTNVTLPVFAGVPGVAISIPPVHSESPKSTVLAPVFNPATEASKETTAPEAVTDQPVNVLAAIAVAIAAAVSALATVVTTAVAPRITIDISPAVTASVKIVSFIT